MISIILCTYNREKYLARAIDSVIAQTYRDWELIIVDDGSTDRTEELVKSYTDPRIRYEKLEKNRYYCYAANYGLKKCQGQYVAFQNSDDEWLPDKLDKQIQFMEAHPEAGACFTEVILVDNDGADISERCIEVKRLFENHYTEQKDWMRYFLQYGNCVCHPSALVKQEVMEQVGGFNLMYCQLADFDLWVRIVTEYPIYVLTEKLIRFRWDVSHKDQISSATERHTVRSFNEQMQIRRQLVERLTDDQMVRYFGEDFRNPSSVSHLELEFEKAFLLMHCVADTPQTKMPGIEKIEEVLHSENAVETLEEHFHITLQNIYSWNQDHWYTDYMINEKLERSRYLNDEIKRVKEECRRLQMINKEYRTSTSWKITAPLRRIGRIYKKITKKL